MGYAMRRIALSVLIVASTLALLRGSATESPSTQHELHVAADKETRSADHEMEVAINRLRAKVSAESNSRLLLDKAQNAWLAYRDAQLEAMWPAADKQVAYGTVYPMCVLIARTELTKRRTAELTAMVRNIEGDVCGGAWAD